MTKALTIAKKIEQATIISTSITGNSKNVDSNQRQHGKDVHQLFQYFIARQFTIIVEKFKVLRSAIYKWDSI